MKQTEDATVLPQQDHSVDDVMNDFSNMSLSQVTTYFRSKPPTVKSSHKSSPLPDINRTKLQYLLRRMNCIIAQEILSYFVANYAHQSLCTTAPSISTATNEDTDHHPQIRWLRNEDKCDCIRYLFLGVEENIFHFRSTDLIVLPGNKLTLSQVQQTTKKLNTVIQEEELENIQEAGAMAKDDETEIQSTEDEQGSMEGGMKKTAWKVSNIVYS
jgi:hypothetical protein